MFHQEFRYINSDRCTLVSSYLHTHTHLSITLHLRITLLDLENIMIAYPSFAYGWDIYITHAS